MSDKLLESIEELLDKSVRPVLQEHFGNIRIVCLNDGVLKVKMLGRCSNCPSAVFENEQLVAEEVKRNIPEVKEVILINEVSDELLSEAKALMGRRHTNPERND